LISVRGCLRFSSMDFSLDDRLAANVIQRIWGE
jgi:hypothetical protein